MKKRFFKNKKTWIFGAVLIVVVAFGVLFLTQKTSDAAASTEPELQTTKVRKGDLLVSSAGVGNVLSSAQADLAFGSGGTVSEIYIVPGQEVTKGEILAELENNSQTNAFIQAKANIDSLFSLAGIAAYQIDAVNAEVAYDSALGYANTLGKPIGSPEYLDILRSAVATAGDALVTAQEKFDGYSETPNSDLKKVQALAALSQAKLNLEDAKAVLAYYSNEPGELDSTTISASLQIASVNFEEAQKALEILKSGDANRLEETLSASSGTSLEKLKQEYLAYENARTTLENTKLIAPFDGVVVHSNLVTGQSVGTASVLTLASTDQMFVKFYMDETDLAGLNLGNKTIYSFNAYPEATLGGEVTLIEQSLETIDGSPAVVAWGSLPGSPSFDLLVGMSVDVEIIAGEAKNALIIPVQALRELAPNSYAVFVVKEDGSLVLTPITIGLRDFANAEVLSGLQLGDVVSTGTVETN